MSHFSKKQKQLPDKQSKSRIDTVIKTSVVRIAKKSHYVNISATNHI